MDNVTHSLVGLAAAKAGLERVSPYATATCIIAANAPDADLLGMLGGRWFYFHNHRGISHSVVGVIVLSLLIPTLFYLADRWQAQRQGRPGRVRWGPLFAVALLLTASHPFLDWTNNYGVRLLLPWDGQWFYGDLTFVVDPFFWLALGVTGFVTTARTKRQIVPWAIWWLIAFGLLWAAPRLRNVELPAVWPWLWLAGGVLAWGLRYAKVPGARVACVALLALAAYLGLLWGLQQRAEILAQTRAQQIAASNGETVTEVAAMPMPGNPVRWLCLATTGRATYRFEVSLIQQAATRPPERFAQNTAEESVTVQQAYTQDERARIWREFARFPAARVTGSCATATLVQLADLRYTEPGAGNGSFGLTVPVNCPPGSQ